MKKYKDDLTKFGNETTMNDEAERLLDEHSSLNIDLMSFHDIEQLDTEDIQRKYDEFISLAIEELQRDLKDDATHDSDTINLAVEDLEKDMEKHRSSFVEDYKESMVALIEVEEQLDLCNEKIQVILPYVNAESEIYGELEYIYDLNVGEQETELTVDSSEREDVYIADLDINQRNKIEEVFRFKMLNAVENPEHIDQQMEIVDFVMETEQLSSLDDLFTPKQMDALLSNEGAYEREMKKGQEMEM